MKYKIQNDAAQKVVEYLMAKYDEVPALKDLQKDYKKMTMNDAKSLKEGIRYMLTSEITDKSSFVHEFIAAEVKKTILHRYRVQKYNSRRIHLSQEAIDKINILMMKVGIQEVSDIESVISNVLLSNLGAVEKEARSINLGLEMTGTVKCLICNNQIKKDRLAGHMQLVHGVTISSN